MFELLARKHAVTPGPSIVTLIVPIARLTVRTHQYLGAQQHQLSRKRQIPAYNWQQHTNAWAQ